MMTMPRLTPRLTTRLTTRRVRPRVPALPLLRCACLGMVQD
jgi:hypothetical protein